MDRAADAGAGAERRTRSLAGERGAGAIAGAAALTCVAFWLPALGSSLWLDETGTAWVVDGGLGTLVHRAALEFQGTSPIYYVFAWAARSIAPGSEIALRLPSVVFMAGAVVVVWRLGTKLLGSWAGVIAAVVFASLGSISFAAADARPYALALLASTGAALATVRWLDEGRRADAIAAVLLTALTVYVHVVFAFTLLALGAYAAARRTSARVSVRAMTAALVAAVVLCAPLIPSYLELARRGGGLSFVEPPPLTDLLRVVAQPLVIFGAGVALYRARRRLAGKASPPRDPAVLTLLLVWAIAAPVALFVLGRLGSIQLFHPRYLVSVAPAVAILAGWALSALEPAILRAAAAAALVAVPVTSYTGYHYSEDWRGAIASVNRTVSARDPVLMSSGYVESRDVFWLTDPERARFVTAPATFYPVAGRLIPMPYEVKGEQRAYVDGLLSRLASERRLVLIANNAPALRAYLSAALESSGFRARMVGAFGRVVVTAFER